MVFAKNTDASVRGMLATLNRMHNLRVDPNEIALKEQMYGFKWSKHSLILHERIRLSLMSSHMWDWAHLLCCDGLADVEVGLFFKRLQQSRSQSSMQEFATFALSFTLPKCYTSLQYILAPDRIKNNLKKGDFSCSASELLTVLPMLQRYLTHTVLARKECERECRCLLLVLDYLERIVGMKSGRNVIDAATLQDKIEAHLQAFKEVYGEDLMRPKHHYILHLAGCFILFGCLLSTLVNERRHKVVKKFTRDRQSLLRWELGALEEVVMQQLHEAGEDWYSAGITNAHAPRGIVLSTLLQLFPSATDFSVSNNAKGQCGRVTCQDMVWCDLEEYSSEPWCAQLNLCFTVTGTQLCIVSRGQAASTSSTWPSFKQLTDLAIVPVDCIVCSAPYKASPTAVSVHKPKYLR